MKVCEISVSYKPSKEASNHPKIRCSQDVEALKWEMYNPDTINYREFFVVVFLNRAGRVIGLTKMFEGGISSTVVDVKMVLQHALLCNASSIILSHNHPSGDVKPSIEDDRLTKKIVDAAKILDIRVNDHIIMTEEGMFSYADQGRL